MPGKRRQPGQPGEPRKCGDSDHRRNQHDPVRPHQLPVFKRFERIHHRKRAAIGKSDQMKRQLRTYATLGFPHRQPRCRRPVFPLDVLRPAGTVP